jgi:hypothetical protein
MKKSIALIFAASALFLAGCCAPNQAAHWEYKTVVDSDASADNLSQLGGQGWEVVSFNPYAGTDGNRHVICLLKRPKP